MGSCRVADRGQCFALIRTYRPIGHVTKMTGEVGLAFYMLKRERSDKCKTNLKGNVLGTCVGPDPRAPLLSLHSGRPDTRVDTRPRTSLSVSLIYTHNIPQSSFSVHNFCEITLVLS